MKKNLPAILALVLMSAFARAQTSDKIAVSLGIDANFTSENSIGGPGFLGRVELPLMPRLKFTFSAGYFVNYFGTRYYLSYMTALCQTCTPPNEPTGPANRGPYEFIPLKAGLRYYYLGHLYLEGEIGEAFKANLTNNSFIYGGAFGALIAFNRHNSLDLGLAYSRGYQFADYDETIYELSIRLAYRYQF
jgi:hypothetical protein